MMSLLTCKDFLKELSDYLDNTVDNGFREELEKHVNDCPNCWVVVDTTQKTLQVFKDAEPEALSPDLHNRLMSALEKKIAAARQ